MRVAATAMGDAAVPLRTSRVEGNAAAAQARVPSTTVRAAAAVR